MRDKALNKLVRECKRRVGQQRSAALVDATREFLARAAQNPSLVADAAAELENLPPAGAAWLALTFGTAVENEGAVEPSLSALLQLFDAWQGALPTTDDDDQPPLTPAQAQLAEALPSLCQALVAHLARAPERRERLARDQAFLAGVEHAESFSYGGAWLKAAITKSSGTLLVLHAPSRQGVRLRYDNVASCFHLFSLLQTAIGRQLPGGRDPDPRVADIARDRAEGKVNDEAWWHFSDAFTKKPDFMVGAIWGDALVSEIPRIDGVRIVVLWPMIFSSRSWESGFFHPHLAAMPADAVVERALSQAECDELFDRLRLETPAKPID